MKSSLNGRITRRTALQAIGMTVAMPAVLRRAYAARTLNVAFTAGLHEKVVKQHVAGQFTEATGIPINIVLRRDQPATEIKLMVQTGSWLWDVTGGVSKESSDQAKDALEPLDFTDPALAAFPDYSKSPVWIGYANLGYIMAWQEKKYPGKTLSYESLLDTAQFPGMRAMRKRVPESAEIALLMSGVDPKDLYKVLATEDGWKTVYKKLDQLRPLVEIWWTQDAQVISTMVSGDLAICPQFNNIHEAARADGAKLVQNWDRGFYKPSGFLIPKGNPNADIAKKFISFFLKPEILGKYCNDMQLGPVLPAANQYITNDITKFPSHPANFAKMYPQDGVFWAMNMQAATDRFNEWLLK